MKHLILAAFVVASPALATETVKTGDQKQDQKQTQALTLEQVITLNEARNAAQNPGRPSYGLGLAASANHSLCMYPTLSGIMQNQETLCAVLRESDALTAKVSAVAGAAHLCTLRELRTTMLAAHGPKFCDGVPLRDDSRAPYFPLSGWHTEAADAYGPHVTNRPDPSRIGAQ
jgi:hypothetical protein